jgi:hypothetical protein
MRNTPALIATRSIDGPQILLIIGRSRQGDRAQQEA